MKYLIKTQAIILFILFPGLMSSQSNDQFVKKVKECYGNPEFNDILYRIENEKKCYLGLEFPTFELTDLDGKPINNESLEGKVAVINFWFTACPPCLEEIPEFNHLIDEIKDKQIDDIVFLAPSSDDKETILKFLKQYGELKSTVIPDALSFLRTTLASKSGFPTTIVLGKDGIIKEYHCGGIKDFDDFKRRLIDLLHED